MSYAYGALCSICIGRGNGQLTSLAMFFLGRVEFNLGCAISHGDSLPWSGPYGKFGAFDSIALLGAYAKLAIDPKQKEKALVRECWDEWQKNPLDLEGVRKYKGNEAFAKDMLSKFESLESSQVITRWCRAWGKERSTQQAQ